VVAAVLAAVAVAGEEEGVGHLSPELAGDVHVADEADHHGARHLPPLRAIELRLVHLEDLGLPVDDEAEGTTYGEDG
jgi:hypothetical protein